MVDIGLDTRVSPSYDPLRYLPGLDGPETISGPSRPVSTVDSDLPVSSVLQVDEHHSSTLDSIPAAASESTGPACSFHDPAHPFNIGYIESQHSSASSLGSQVYLDPAYQEYVANLER